MTERGMTAVLVHESSEPMVGNVCMGAYRLVYQSPKDLLTSERWRDMGSIGIYGPLRITLARVSPLRRIYGATIRAIWKQHTRHAMKSASAVSCRTATKVNVRDFTHVEYISAY